MYLMATHIPIYVDGDRTFVGDSWYSDLVLARDFFSPRFGEVTVLGPRRPLVDVPEKVCEVGPGITDSLRLVASAVDERTRTREWPKAARRWRADLLPLVRQARVVHASVDDPFRAMQLAALRAAFDAGRPTVLIGFDMDVWDTLGVQLAQMRRLQGALHVARTVGMDGWMRYAVRRASVAMLKEGLVYDRYSALARNPKAFCHSMHSEKHLVDDATFEARVESMRTGRPLRFGYFGRFVERKGLADAIRILAAARVRGVDASYDLVGWGPQQPALQALARQLGVAEHVRFRDAIPYGPELHATLRTYDALLFTPTEEDTPRMIYDAFAAGLPLITTDVAFLRRRAQADRASVLFGVGDIEGGARAVQRLHEQREQLVELARLARAAGRYHTIEHWYGRRLEWTVDAVERHARSAS